MTMTESRPRPLSTLQLSPPHATRSDVAVPPLPPLPAGGPWLLFVTFDDPDGERGTWYLGVTTAAEEVVPAIARHAAHLGIPALWGAGTFHEVGTGIDTDDNWDVSVPEPTSGVFVTAYLSGEEPAYHVSALPLTGLSSSVPVLGIPYAPPHPTARASRHPFDSPEQRAEALGRTDHERVRPIYHGRAPRVHDPETHFATDTERAAYRQGRAEGFHSVLEYEGPALDVAADLPGDDDDALMAVAPDGTRIIAIREAFRGGSAVSFTRAGPRLVAYETGDTGVDFDTATIDTSAGQPQFISEGGTIVSLTELTFIRSA